MKIRFSKQHDIPKIQQIMSAVFGDTALFLDLLFQSKYDDNVVVCDDNGVIVGSAFLFPATMDGKPITYIYGCATLPSYRGKGIMQNILEFSYQHICSRDEIGVFLVPATPDLFLYYKKRGFSDFFYHKKTQFELFEYKVKLEKQFTFTRITPHEYYELRHQFLPQRIGVIWEEKHFELVEKEYIDTKGGFFKVMYRDETVGVGFYYMFNFKTIIPEFLGTIDENQLANIFFNQVETNKIEMYTPGEQTCFGMAKWNPKFNHDKIEKGYFAFALD